MSIKTLLRADLLDNRISSICNHLYFLHKSENIRVDTYIEYQTISETYTDYAGDENLKEVI